MARLEHIHFASFDASLGTERELVWAEDKTKAIEDLPQIFWDDKSSWDEVNLWALERAASQSVVKETVKRSMKHLLKYASWLEVERVDWQYFPMRREDRALGRFRGYLIDQMRSGTLAGTTAAACMSACVQFYRWANSHKLVGARFPMWTDRPTQIKYNDVAGFQRSISTLTNDLQIPNRTRIGFRLEDGLLPLRNEHMNQLLTFLHHNESAELHLIVLAGFFTGARIGTITTLTVESLASAREDPTIPGMYFLPVGPGTGITTKFDVKGSLIVPRAVLEEFKRYASSSTRLTREAKAQKAHKSLLLITRRGQPFTVETADRLTYEMRKRAVTAGLQFMTRFRFHQTRATFGTWLMQILLDCGLKTTEAIQIVRDAMLHKSERTTLGYITFLENTRGKQQVAAAFNEAFTGIGKRDWNQSGV